MDAKSLAKSKRAHSQHHSKKHHPSQTSKNPSAGSVGASITKKPPSKQIKEKSHQSQGSSALPSNWDRYEEEYDSGVDSPSQDNTSQPTDVIEPKSKGADYAHLISEAKSQFQTNSFSESFPSFDDVFTDFNQGVGSLLSVKGKSILSWIGDDNFVVEDKATASHEASFLSLDLHALAEQLAKVDISQRLFIEADLLPPELCTGELQASSKPESDQNEANTIEAAKNGSYELASQGLSDRNKSTVQYSEITSDSTTTTTTSHLVPNLTDIRSKSINQVKDELPQFGETSQRTMVGSATEFNVNSVTITKKIPSRFEAATAEAELDMLLDSFNEPNFLDSPGSISYASQERISASLLEGISSDQLGLTLPVKKIPDLSKSALGADLDDTLDDLLKEGSDLINRNGVSGSHELKTGPLDVLSSLSSRPTSKSKLLDDFDSWLDTI